MQISTTTVHDYRKGRGRILSVVVLAAEANDVNGKSSQVVYGNQNKANAGGALPGGEQDLNKVVFTVPSLASEE